MFLHVSELTISSCVFRGCRNCISVEGGMLDLTNSDFHSCGESCVHARVAPDTRLVVSQCSFDPSPNSDSTDLYIEGIEASNSQVNVTSSIFKPGSTTNQIQLRLDGSLRKNVGNSCNASRSTCIDRNPY